MQFSLSLLLFARWGFSVAAVCFLYCTLQVSPFLRFFLLSCCTQSVPVSPFSCPLYGKRIRSMLRPRSAVLCPAFTFPQSRHRPLYFVPSHVHVCCLSACRPPLALTRACLPSMRFCLPSFFFVSATTSFSRRWISSWAPSSPCTAGKRSMIWYDMIRFGVMRCTERFAVVWWALHAKRWCGRRHGTVLHDAVFGVVHGGIRSG